jgi:carbamoyl-phosphate synthase large subunit
MGWTIDQVYELTKIDKWFLAQMKELVEFENELHGRAKMAHLDGEMIYGQLQRAKEWGYSDVQLATIWGISPAKVRLYRSQLKVQPVYKLVDTCAAEFEAYTPYYYSTYETPYTQLSTINQQPTTISEDEIRLSNKPKVLIIGGGPNRIGQGIEFEPSP